MSRGHVIQMPRPGQAPAVISPEQQVLSKFRVVLALPFEVLGYKVRTKLATVDENGNESAAPEASRVLAVQILDPWSGVTGAATIPIEKILLAKEPGPMAAQVGAQIRSVIGERCAGQHMQAAWFARLMQSKRGEALYKRFRAWIERRHPKEAKA